MIDSITSSQGSAGLLEVGCSEADAWDISAVADWPNIVPASTAPISSAELLAADFQHAR